MTERFFEEYSPDDVERLSVMRNTERAIAEYANQSLADSTVSVEISDCKSPFINLPLSMYENLGSLPVQPKAITAVDLKLNYDREARKFTTLYAGLKMDNSYSLIFHRIAAKLPGQEEPLYYGALLTPSGTIAKKTDKTQLLNELEVGTILKAVGVGLPEEEQEAIWDEIKDILQFAGAWTATTSKTTPLDLVRTVHITDTVKGTGNDPRHAHREVIDDGITSRNIIFAVDQAGAPTEPAHSTWKIQAHSESQHETPTIRSIEHIPLEFKLPRYEDYDMEILGEMNYVRHECQDLAEPKNLEVAYLQPALDLLQEISQ